MMTNLFNVWVDGQRSKTTIIADSMPKALDIFCARHGFIDHADYCQEKGLTEFNGGWVEKINIQEVAR